MLFGSTLSNPSQAEQITAMSLMFQKEVAMRITAKVGDSAYGRLAVITQWRAEAEMLFDIPAEAFVPPPKITSTLIRVIPRPAPLFGCEMHHLEAVTKIAFGQRRKMFLGDSPTPDDANPYRTTT